VPTRRALLALVALVALLVLSACERGTPSGPLEVLLPTEIETIDPRATTDAASFRASRLVHAGLAGLHAQTLEPFPLLAESFTWEGPLTLRVKLRRGARFHGGKPLDADDVIATFAAFGKSRFAHVVEPIQAITRDDDDVRFVLKRPHATLLSALEVPILRADQAPSALGPGQDLDGLGPYRVASMRPGELALTPASNGLGSPAVLPVTLRTVKDENARALRLLSGRADLVQNGISPTLLPALQGRPGIFIQSQKGANLTYMMARGDRGALSDARVRRAISMGIDRARIARTLLSDTGTPASSLLPEGHWARTDRAPLPFDPDGARALLKQAGAASLKLTLSTSTDRLRGTIARTMAQMLADIGIVIEVVPLEFGSLLARLNAGEFELATLQLPEIAEPNSFRVFLHSSQIPPYGSNRARVNVPAVDELLDRGARELDLTERRRIYASLDDLVLEQALWIPLFYERHIAVLGPRAQAYVPSADGRYGALATLK
jgi:peptide/nickel transport system substrate-binding protein